MSTHLSEENVPVQNDSQHILSSSTGSCASLLLASPVIIAAPTNTVLTLIFFTSGMSQWLLFLITLLITSSHGQAWSPMVVKSVAALGPQLSPGVTNVSRDGGYSALINGNIVWLYDDTECTDLQGKQLSFISNTATYQSDPQNLSTVTDFGVVDLGKTGDGTMKTAILAGTTVGTGGWVPFQPDELDFNQKMVGKERVAICKPSAVNVDHISID